MSESQNVGNIVLTGFMGSGKTTIGKILTKKLNMNFLDMDDVIEKERKMTINEIFSRFGEKHFRKLEKELTKRISKKDNYVVATGGGVVLDKENVKNLRENGIIIWLSVSSEQVLKRTKEDKTRPLLKADNPGKRIEELLKLRESFYAKADLKVETTERSVPDIVQEILDFLKVSGFKSQECRNG